MRKYLLSLMAVVIAVTLVGATTYAFESDSIKAENTFDFYENEFDFMLQPAKLAGQDSTLAEGHKLVEGFTGYRLFTNLSNQAADDAYQIGGIIAIPNGGGNIGILLDCQKFEKESRENDPSRGEVVNIYFGYGIAAPNSPVSVGLSYAYGSIDIDRDRDADREDNIISSDLTFEYGSRYDYTAHEPVLEVRVNQAPVDMLLGLSLRYMEGENEYDNVIISSETVTGDNNVFTNTVIAIDSYGCSIFPSCGYGNRDGYKFSVYTEDVFELTPTVAIGLDFSYNMGDYDDEEALVLQENSVNSVRTGILNGEIDNDEYYARLELRLTFPQVRFALGVSYDHFMEEGDYEGEWVEKVVPGDGLELDIEEIIDDLEVTGGDEVTLEYEIDLDTWRFPVATEFNITERLVCRLGAEFVYGEWKKALTDTWVNGNDTESWDRDTFSRTTYNVGLGYQVTENLDVDVMWRHADSQQDGEPVKREGVDSDLLFVGATLAF